MLSTGHQVFPQHQKGGRRPSRTNASVEATNPTTTAGRWGGTESLKLLLFLTKSSTERLEGENMYLSPLVPHNLTAANHEAFYAQAPNCRGKELKCFIKYFTSWESI